MIKKMIYAAFIGLILISTSACRDKLTEQQMFDCAIQQKVSCEP